MRECSRAGKEAVRPIVYHRTVPAPSHGTNDAGSASDRSARLQVSADSHIGTGSSSRVFRAELEIFNSALFRTVKVGVAAKVPYPSEEARSSFNQETHIYSQFPDHLSQHWSGFCFVKPIKIAQAVGPVVPHFYGRYEAEDQTKYQPLLLMEDCGFPIDLEAARTRHRY